MTHRINRTGRKTIRQRDVEVRVDPADDGGPPVVGMMVELSEYQFPNEARIRLEVSRSNMVQRWKFGTVGEMVAPPVEERRLTDVPAGGTWRMFVVAADGSDRLLGHAPRLRPKMPVDSLLPLEPSIEMGEEIWRVEFDEGGGGNPVLFVNANIEGISDLVRTDPTFRALVMPAVFRIILTRMVIIERAEVDDEGWNDWYRTAHHYLPGKPIPNVSKAVPVEELAGAEAWIDEVVEAFAAHLGAERLYTEATPT